MSDSEHNGGPENGSPRRRFSGEYSRAIGLGSGSQGHQPVEIQAQWSTPDITISSSAPAEAHRTDSQPFLGAYESANTQGLAGDSCSSQSGDALDAKPDVEKLWADLKNSLDQQGGRQRPEEDRRILRLICKTDERIKTGRVPLLKMAKEKLNPVRDMAYLVGLVDQCNGE